MKLTVTGRRRPAADVAVTLLFCTAGVLSAGPEQKPPTLDELVAQYRDGDADLAVRTLASWPEDRLRSENSSSKSTDDGWDAATRALFHYEALRQPEATRYPRAIQLHKVIADSHLGNLCRSFSDAGDALRVMCRDLALMLRIRGDAWPDLVKQFHEDPVVVLAYGRYQEYWAPRIDGTAGNEYGFQIGAPVLNSDHGRFGPEVYEAEATFRRVLKIAPSMVEARVRLGRVLWQMDRRSDAQRELQQAVTDSMPGSPEWAYLANVFLGQILEEGGRSTEAVDAYRAALRILPRGQVASIRLGRVLVETGVTGAGWQSAAAAVLESPVNMDPWTKYFSAQWSGPEDRARARALRERLRREIPR